jgi:hypothetical protein
MSSLITRHEGSRDLARGGAPLTTHAGGVLVWRMTCRSAMMGAEPTASLRVGVMVRQETSSVSPYQTQAPSLYEAGAFL